LLPRALTWMCRVAMPLARHSTPPPKVRVFGYPSGSANSS